MVRLAARLVAATALFLAHGVNEAAVIEPSVTSTRAELVRITKDQLDAANRDDMTSFGRDLAEDLIYIPSEGTPFSKAQVLARNARLFNAGVIKKWGEPRDIRVVDEGNSALLTARVTEVVSYGRQDLTYELVRTAHFAKRGGQWKTVLIQLTELPENHLQPEIRTLGELRAILGRYALTKGFVVTVKLDAGKLYSRTRSDGSWDELVPVGNQAFRWPHDPADITFVRSPQGRVTHYVYRRPDGQQLVATRLAD